MSSEVQQPDADALTQAQRHRLDRHWGDQDRTLLAMQQPEAALAQPPRGGNAPGAHEVRRTLGVLAEAARDEASNADQPDSLLSDIFRTQPWLRSRVAGCGPATPSCGTASRGFTTSWLPRAGRRRTSPSSASGCRGCSPGSGPARPRIRPHLRGLLRRVRLRPPPRRPTGQFNLITRPQNSFRAKASRARPCRLVLCCVREFSGLCDLAGDLVKLYVLVLEMRVSVLKAASGLSS